MNNISGYIQVESDGRHTCIHAMEEEVDYDFYCAVDGSSIVIPDWVECPPMVICGYDGKPSTCTGRDCGHYVNAYTMTDRDAGDAPVRMDRTEEDHHDDE